MTDSYRTSTSTGTTPNCSPAGTRSKATSRAPTGTGASPPIPPATTHVVPDADLAAEDATYHSQGVAGTGMRFDYQNGDIASTIAFLLRPVDLPGRRTELYTPGDWYGHLFQGPRTEYSFPEEAVRHIVREPGGMTTVDWNRAPLGVGLRDDSAVRTGEGLGIYPALFDDAAGDIISDTSSAEVVTCTASLTHAGEVLESNDYCGVNVELPAEPEGAFTFTADATRAAPWTALGTAAHMSWTFTAPPFDPSLEDGTPLPISTVRLSSDSVVNGFAPRGEPQCVELDVVRFAEAATKRLTFEVSYDDGKTWRKVVVHRNGEHATATLVHPKGAEFVSTRFTVVDNLGNTASSSVIRAYGLS